MNVELESLGLTHSCCLFTVYATLGSLFYTSLCPVVSSPRDRTPPGSSVHGFSQARIQKWVAISFSRVSSRPRDWALCVSCVSCVGRLMTTSAVWNGNSNPCPALFTKLVKSGSRMLILERTQVFSSQRVLGFESQLWHPLAVWTGTRDWICLGLGTPSLVAESADTDLKRHLRNAWVWDAWYLADIQETIFPFFVSSPVSVILR